MDTPPSSLISIRGKALKLQTQDDCAPVIKLIQDHPTATSIHLCGNSLGVDACKLIGEALQSNTTLVVCSNHPIFQT